MLVSFFFLFFPCIATSFSLTADPGGPGICAFILTLFSFLLILATFPLSLCFSVKVSEKIDALAVNLIIIKIKFM